MTSNSEGYHGQRAVVWDGTRLPFPVVTSTMVSPMQHPVKNSKHLGIQEGIRKRFESWELSLIKEEALQEYGLLKNISERRDLERKEEIARGELIADAVSLFAALDTWNLEATKELQDDRALRLFSERLQKRVVSHQRQCDDHENRLREAGRAEWRREVEETVRMKEHELSLQKWLREREEILYAACAFLMGTETRWRRDEVAEEAAAWEKLCAQEVVDREDAERRAYENFMNTPEQVALREEQNRKAAIGRKKAAQRMAKFLKEQEFFVKSCKHSRGQTSFFDGPNARKLCVLCGVKFDEQLGYYVRVRGKTIAPPAEMNTALEQLGTGKKPPQTALSLPAIRKQ